jgi:hypothetical protein
VHRTLAHRVIVARQDQELRRAATRMASQILSLVEETSILPSYKGCPALFCKWDRSFSQPKLKQVSSTASNLRVVFQPGTKTSFATDRGDVDTIVLGVGNAHSVVDYLKKNKRVLLHELIHVLDRVRLGDESLAEAHKSYPDPVKDPERYYNHPLELNAVFLEMVGELFESVETSLLRVNADRNDADHQTAVMILWEWLNQRDGAIFAQCQKNFWLKASRPVKKYLTNENKKRFEKRLYSVWNKQVKQVRDLFESLRHQNDETLEMMEM